MSASTQMLSVTRALPFNSHRYYVIRGKNRKCPKEKSRLPEHAFQISQNSTFAHYIILFVEQSRKEWHNWHYEIQNTLQKLLKIKSICGRRIIKIIKTVSAVGLSTKQIQRCSVGKQNNPLLKQAIKMIITTSSTAHMEPQSFKLEFKNKEY